MLQFVTRDGVNGQDIAGVNWGFDAYGGMNDEHELDDQIASCICKQADIDLIEGPMVLEAGSIHVDGEGCVPCPSLGILSRGMLPSTCVALTKKRVQRWLIVGLLSRLQMSATLL